jgi:ATPase subunit of ABC transporter with duplicated ATPase domains
LPSIDLLGVHHAFAESVPLFRDLDLQLRPGWAAVVGANGAGKTTLLRLVAGLLDPDGGAVRRTPASLGVHLCPQTVQQLDPATEAFAARGDRTAHRLRGQLLLDSSPLEHWDQLSPGEKKRWQIATALADEPGALLLDEPTNHIDGEARGLLQRALERYDGIGVMVSHDRQLMNQLATRTLRLDHGQLTPYRGGYGQACESWELEQSQQRDAHQKLRSERKKLARKIDDRRRKWQRAVDRATTSKRMKGPRDNASGGFKLARRRSAENAIGREIHKLHGTLGRVEEQAAKVVLERSIGRSLFVDYQPAPMPTLAALDEASLRAGQDGSGRVLLRDVRIHVRRETRLHLAGPNGSGKTSLLRRLIASSRIPDDRMLYLPQELSLAEARALLDEARRLDPATRGRTLGIMAALGVEPDALLESQQPSPGEARKLALAAGLSREVWWLVLDEPTNHLDLPSIERLEQALADYPGAIVLATHDERFAERTTSDRLELADYVEDAD